MAVQCTETLLNLNSLTLKCLHLLIGMPVENLLRTVSVRQRDICGEGIRDMEQMKLALEKCWNADGKFKDLNENVRQ